MLDGERMARLFGELAEQQASTSSMDDVQPTTLSDHPPDTLKLVHAYEMPRWQYDVERGIYRE
jgi:hypothetical protein